MTMKLKNAARAFLRDEGGAATVDFIVLTAAGVAMSIAVMAEVREGVDSLAARVSSNIAASQIGPAAPAPEGEDPG